MNKTLFKSMFKRLYPESMIIRRAICTAVAMFIAVITDRYYSMLHEFWVGLTTVLILQMTIRTSFRVEVVRYLVIIASVAFGTLLVLYIPTTYIVDGIIVTVFVLGCFLQSMYPAKNSGFSPPFVIGLVTLLMLVPFAREGNILFARLHDVVLGGFIGVLAGLVIFPARPDIDFRIGVVPILKGYSEYLVAVTKLFFQEPNAAQVADDKKAEMEITLQARQVFFPDWVYETGFTENLRQGHRHFLLRVEQLGEILFAMHYQARYAVNADLLDQIREPIMRCIGDATRLIDDLCVVLDKADLKTSYHEFAENVLALENMFNTKIAIPYELTDTSKDYVHATGFIYAIKDLQQVLSRMEEALRGYISRIEPI
jgi:hypothetical protein